MTDAKRIAVAGLGSMGSGMALSCLRAGHALWGIDVNPDAVARLTKAGAQTTPLPRDLDCALIVVLTADQTRDVLFGAGRLADNLRPGGVVIGCATVPPDFAREMETACTDAGLHYLDAPISGGAARAAEGALSVMAAGSEAAFAAARPVLDACATTVFDLGRAAGAGSAMKAVNQLLAGVHIVAMAEAMTFGISQGIAPQQFLDVISKCAGTSWMLENRAPHVVAGDYTPKSQINIWPKDLGIVLDVAQRAGFSAPLTATALDQYRAAVGMGLGREDDAALVKVYARAAGLSLPDPPDGTA